jgi:hypothetical protein
MQTDPDVWAAGLVALGSGGAKVLSLAEHIDFLVSISDGRFKMIFDFWNSAGWFLALGLGLIWLGDRYFHRNEPHRRSPSWGLVVSASFVALLFGALGTVLSASSIPRVIANWGGNGCQATLDTSHLQSFANGYKIALVCVVQDPTTDILTDKRLVVSNLFTIVPGGITIIAPMTLQTVPSVAPQVTPPTSTPPPAPQPSQALPPVEVTIGYLAVLVPNDVGRDKITTLADLERLGGKILDPKYYKQ